jgi:hypothetical protein
MKYGTSLLRISVLLFGITFLTGCDYFASVFNPFIGNWQATLNGSTTEKATINANGTYSLVITDGTTTSTKSGTWSSPDWESHPNYNTVTLTITSPSSAAATEVWNYSISEDRVTMVLTVVSYTESLAPLSPITFTNIAQYH